MHSQRIVAGIIMAPLAFATGAGAVSPSCVPSAAKTLAASGAAAIYAQGTQLYGCLDGHRTRLGASRGTVPFPATRVALYVLKSPYAGIDNIVMGVDTFSSTVAIVDLRSGATTATAAATTPEGRPESFISVASMVIDTEGTLAWIGERSAIGVRTPTFEVHTLNSAGGRLLASAPDIAPKSLVRRGETLRWRAGGRTFSVSL